jgi:hypothetical protein
MTEQYLLEKQIINDSKEKGKAIPLQPLTGPEGSRRLRLPDIKKVVRLFSLTHRPPIPPGNIPGTHFC